MGKEAAEPMLALNGPDVNVGILRNWRLVNTWRSVVEPLVWPIRIIIHRVRLDDVVHVAEAEAEEVIQAFAFEAADPGFGIAVGDRRHVRRLDRAAIRSLEERIEGARELGVAIMDQVTNINAFILGPHAHIPRLLLNPLRRRVESARRDEDLSAGEVNKSQRVSALSAEGRPDRLAEEVAGDHHVHVNRDERSPGRVVAFRGMPIGIGQDHLVGQDPTDRTAAGPDGQLLQFTQDAPNAPARILAGQPENQLPQRPGQPRAVKQCR